MAEKLDLEIWSDSFHEGNWLCEELCNFFELSRIDYHNGFIPSYVYRLEDVTITCTVFGRYDNWTPLPQKVKDVKSLGKPDMIVYNPVNEKVLMSIEETAAIPTGNQSMQRCERFYGSAREQVPFWYLIGEFGVHKDGGVRRDSIWPTILSIRLSSICMTPSVVLHYSDKENPEDYGIGEGVNTLFETLSNYIKIELGLYDNNKLIIDLAEQYKHMFDFVLSQADSIVTFLPSKDLLKDKELPIVIASSAIKGEVPDDKLLGFLVWPTTKGLPKDIYDSIVPGGVINSDKLVDGLEHLVKNKLAYNIIKGAGSKPQKWTSIQGWIEGQKDNWSKSKVEKRTSLSYDSLNFKKTDSGNYHLTTAKNVFYLIDSTKDLEKILNDKFSYKKQFSFEIEIPVFFYISNSLLKGRIFGDPFTGQLSAYSNIFSKNNLDKKTRLSIAYYPYQVHTQVFNSKGGFNKNKGIDICRELIDYAIFHSGVIVNMKTGEILC
jgi:hypothetical protein